MLDISKHHLTGFILLKKTSDSSHRFVFTNEFGMKFFDFEISGGKFIVHYCFPSLEKRSLLKILRTDFCILLDFRRELKIKTVKENDDKSGKQVKMTNQYGKWLVSIDNEFHLIKKIESSGKIISRTRVEISSSEIMPTGIVLLNPFIKLSLKMKLLSL